MKLVNKVLNLIFYLTMISMVTVAFYAFWDAVLVSKSADMDDSLIKLAHNNDDDTVFEELDRDSEYVIAWLSIEGTNIDYPVVQGKDNEYFLNRNYKGKYATAGSLFLDYRNNRNFKDFFSIIYGHRMGNGEMFSDIHKFKELSFLESHKTGQLKLRGIIYVFEIIAYAEIRADDWGIYNVENSRNDRTVVDKILNKKLHLKFDNNSYVLLSTCDGAKKKMRNVLLIKILV